MDRDAKLSPQLIERDPFGWVWSLVAEVSRAFPSYSAEDLIERVPFFVLKRLSEELQKSREREWREKRQEIGLIGLASAAAQSKEGEGFIRSLMSEGAEEKAESREPSLFDMVPFEVTKSVIV